MNDADPLVARVASMVLRGAPQTIVVDPAALGAPGSREAGTVETLLAALGLEVVTVDADLPTLDRPAVAILGTRRPVPVGYYAWYVGPGAVPTGMHATPGEGSRSTAAVLGLLGTGMAQERAGAAFRAAGAARQPPRSISYSWAPMLDGISRALAPLVAEKPTPVALTPTTPDVGDAATRTRVLTACADALDVCCAENGAIAAAPHDETGGPDYWFFWQRDAAHVAVALYALARRAPTEELRLWAASRLAGYVAFIATLGPVLAGSAAGLATARCSMAGQPIGGYGDPQPDGLAATALAVLTVIDDPRMALTIAQPFLTYLTVSGPADTAYDLWELTVGRSFHAVNLARRALRRATRIAGALGDPRTSGYHGTQVRLSGELDGFRRTDGPGLLHCRTPRPPWFAATSGLDMSVVGSTLLAYEIADDSADITADGAAGTAGTVEDGDVAATVAQLEASYRRRWPVNATWTLGGRDGFGIGRFPRGLQ